MFVPMTKQQQTIHDEYQAQTAMLIFKWRRMKFLSENDRKRLLLYLSIMRMVCDSTFILDQKTRYDTKIDEIMAIISNLIDSGDGKVVIFSQWERMLRILSQQLDSKQIDYCFLHGGVPSYKRKGIIDRFRNDPDCRVFLSTDAGSTGLNLQSASLLINIDLPWNPAVLEQRIARIYRIGQQNPVQIINMVARGTIEERMLATLNFKSNLAAGILDGGDDAVFLENKKFDKIVEVVETVINESPATPTQPTPPTTTDGTTTTTTTTDSTTTICNSIANGTAKSDTATEIESTTPNITQDRKTSPATTNNTTNNKDNSNISPHNTGTNTPQTPAEMRDLIAGGMEILGTIVNVLRNPESVQTLADALVKEDPTTGQTTLNIPVPNKNTVTNLLSALSYLLHK